MIPPIRRNAFTLVELLVVTGLLASLLSLVIVAMRPTAESQVRELARNLQSALMQTQTRSLTGNQGACLVLVADSATTSGVAFASNTAYFAEPRTPVFTLMQAPTGTTLEELLTTGTSNLFNTGTTVGAFFNPTNADLPSLETGYRVRFSTGSTFGPWYNFYSNNNYDGAGRLLALLTRPKAPVDPAINVWPATTGNQIACEVVRQPSKLQTAVIAPKLASIDLRYSGVGDQPSPLSFTTSETAGPNYWYSSFRSIPNDGISFDFNRTGLLTEIFRFTPPQQPPKKGWETPPISATATIYFLVASNDDIAADRSLQSSVSIWVAVNPQSGAVRMGKNNPAPPPATAGLGKELLEQEYANWFRNLRVNAR